MAKRFGVEIECVGDRQLIARALRQAGLEVEQIHSHIGNRATKWVVKRDGSIMPDGGGDRGVEIVSPPLDFNDPEQRAQVDRALVAIKAGGGETHYTAGIHIHIDAKHEDGRRMTSRELAAVVRFTYKFEDAMYRIASAGWQTIREGARTYACPIPEGTARAVMGITEDSQDLWEIWNGSVDWVRRHRANRRWSSIVLNEMERYTATNLHAFQAHGTVEFRYFNSSLNPKRVQGYIALCMAIMDDARNGFSRSVKKSYRLGAMYRGEVDEKALMMRLQQIFRSNSRDTKVCMSEEDWKNLRNVCWRQSHPQQSFYDERRREVFFENNDTFVARARRLTNHIQQAGDAIQGLSEASQQAGRSIAAMEH